MNIFMWVVSLIMFTFGVVHSVEDRQVGHDEVRVSIQRDREELYKE